MHFSYEIISTTKGMTEILRHQNICCNSRLTKREFILNMEKLIYKNAGELSKHIKVVCYCQDTIYKYMDAENYRMFSQRHTEGDNQ
jgi:hypothetical protein